MECYVSIKKSLRQELCSENAGLEIEKVRDVPGKKEKGEQKNVEMITSAESGGSIVSFQGPLDGDVVVECGETRSCCSFMGKFVVVSFWFRHVYVESKSTFNYQISLTFNISIIKYIEGVII